MKTMLLAIAAVFAVSTVSFANDAVVKKEETTAMHKEGTMHKEGAMHKDAKHMKKVKKTKETTEENTAGAAAAEPAHK